MDLNKMAWLAGSWRGEHGSGVAEEIWTAPTENVMLGVGRVVRDGRAVSAEFMTIRLDSDEVTWSVYLPLADRLAGNGRHTLVSLTDTEFMVEDPDTAFPLTILYRHVESGHLYVRLSGERNGEPASVEFNFTRQPV